MNRRQVTTDASSRLGLSLGRLIRSKVRACTEPPALRQDGLGAQPDGDEPDPPQVDTAPGHQRGVDVVHMGQPDAVRRECSVDEDRRAGAGTYRERLQWHKTRL